MISTDPNPNRSNFNTFLINHQAAVVRGGLLLSSALIIIGALGAGGVLPIGAIGSYVLLGVSLSAFCTVIIARCYNMRHEDSFPYKTHDVDMGFRRSQAIDPKWNSPFYSLKTSSCMDIGRQFFMIELKKTRSTRGRTLPRPPAESENGSSVPPSPSLETRQLHKVDSSRDVWGDL